MTAILRVPRRAALIAVSILVAAASLTSFAESYRGLYLWAARHGLSGPWAVAWPLQVDTFIAVGELALFVALADRWLPRSRMAAWTVTLAGLAVSVAGNVGHVTGHSLTDRGTAAVPPLAAASALAVGLGVLKRVVGAHHRSAPESAPGAHPESAPEGALALALAGAPESAPGLNGRVHPGAPLERTRDRSPKRTRSAPAAPVTGDDAEREFMTDLASGTLPSQRQIRARMHVGQDRARQLREHLETVTART
jgi:hypothetical protein